jgi:hypothetical protein
LNFFLWTTHFSRMREKRKEKETVIDGEPKTDKKHALPG